VTSIVTEEELSSGGFFAGMDADEFDGISTNPWEIADGTYRAQVFDCTMEKKDDGTITVLVQWQIDDPEKDEDKSRVRQYFTLYYGRSFKELDGDEKKSVKRFKRLLIIGLDFTETEAATVKPQDCLGRKAYITVKNNPDKEDKDKIYTNVINVECERIFKEKNGDLDSTTGMNGF